MWVSAMCGCDDAIALFSLPPSLSESVTLRRYTEQERNDGKSGVFMKVLDPEQALVFI